MKINREILVFKQQDGFTKKEHINYNPLDRGMYDYETIKTGQFYFSVDKTPLKHLEPGRKRFHFKEKIITIKYIYEEIE